MNAAVSMEVLDDCDSTETRTREDEGPQLSLVA